MERQRHDVEAGRQPHRQGRRRLPHDRHRDPVVRRRRGRSSTSTASTRRRTRSRTASTARRRRATRSRACCSAIRRATRATRAAWRVSSPFNAFVHYFGGYIQDDWRVSPKLTLNYGVRLEHEDGPAGRERRLHRGVRPDAQSGRRARRIVNRQRPAGSRRPGLCRRQNGANEYQGDPPAHEVLAARRHGVLVQSEDGGARRLRHLLGAVELPGASARANYGQIGFSQKTFISQGQFCPTRQPDQPVPGRRAASRSATRCGALTGVGGADRVHRSGQEAPYVQQYSVDLDARAAPATSRSASSTSARPAATSASAARTTASSTSTRCRSSTCRLARRCSTRCRTRSSACPAGQG